MDMPESAGRPTGIEQSTILIDVGLKPAVKVLDGHGIEDAGIERHRLGIAGDDLADADRAVARPRDLRPRMEVAESVGQILPRLFIGSVPVCPCTPRRPRPDAVQRRKSVMEGKGERVNEKP